MSSPEEIVENWIKKGNTEEILEICNWYIDDLSIVPDEVERLNISNTTITRLNKLPKNLRWLKCTYTNLEELPDSYPENLKYVDIRVNENLKICKLPKGIKFKTDFNALQYEEYLKNTPKYIILKGRLENIKKNIKRKHKLDISDLDLKEIPIGIPDFVTKLVCRNNPIKYLTNLPPNLKILKCEGTDLKSLKGIPESLEKIDCTCTDITSFEGLPNNVKIIKAEYCRKLKYIYYLPESLEYLRLDNCPIRHIRYIPPKCKGLDMSELQLKHIPYLPDSLEVLKCILTNKLERIYNLPKSLKVLDVWSYIPFPDLPDNLLYLRIPSLKLINNSLPNSIEYVDTDEIFLKADHTQW